MPDAPTTCFHCGEALGGRRVAWARLHDADVPVCCQGCKAAAEMIALCGLEEFYRFRSAPSVKPQESNAEWVIYDDPALLERLTRRNPMAALPCC
jgi:Cu2+-exporting ATPase